jgi:hypothetical protein
MSSEAASLSIVNIEENRKKKDWVWILMKLLEQLDELSFIKGIAS